MTLKGEPLSALSGLRALTQRHQSFSVISDSACHFAHERVYYAANSTMMIAIISR
jgi:hypothetical protein